MPESFSEKPLRGSVPEFSVNFKTFEKFLRSPANFSPEKLQNCFIYYLTAGAEL